MPFALCQLHLQTCAFSGVPCAENVERLTPSHPPDHVLNVPLAQLGVGLQLLHLV